MAEFSPVGASLFGTPRPECVGRKDGIFSENRGWEKDSDDGNRETGRNMNACVNDLHPGMPVSLPPSRRVAA